RSREDARPEIRPSGPERGGHSIDGIRESAAQDHCRIGYARGVYSLVRAGRASDASAGIGGVGDADSAAEHGLGIDLVRDSQTRPQGESIIVGHIAVAMTWSAAFI